MRIIVLALVTGIIMGFVFALLKLPDLLSCLTRNYGDCGYYLGFKVYEWLSQALFHTLRKYKILARKESTSSKF